MKVKKIAKEQEIWDKKEKIAKSEEEAKELVPPKFYKWIHIFWKKTSERMLTRKLQNYTIKVKKEFVLRKGKVYPLSREERKEVCKFIEEQLRKEYIKPLKSSQMVSMFTMIKKDSKSIWYRTRDI